MNVCVSEAFKEGFTNAICFNRKPYNVRITTQIDTYNALREDWINVGKAIEKSAKECERIYANRE